MGLTRHFFEGREPVIEDRSFHLARRINIHLRGEFFMFVDETGAYAEHAFSSRVLREERRSACTTEMLGHRGASI